MDEAIAINKTVWNTNYINKMHGVKVVPGAAMHYTYSEVLRSLGQMYAQFSSCLSFTTFVTHTCFHILAFDVSLTGGK